MVYHYAHNVDEKSAKAVGIALPVSTKQAVEICRFIRGKNVEKAVKELKEVIDEKRAIPFRRYNRGGIGHRPGIGPGRYPKKACGEILKVVNSAASNAKSKGLSSLIIRFITPQKAATQWHYGRKRRRQAKRTHIEVIVSEEKEKVPGKKEKPGAKETKK